MTVFVPYENGHHDVHVDSTAQKLEYPGTKASSLAVWEALGRRFYGKQKAQSGLSRAFDEGTHQ